jgi:hypothetical protein
MYVLDVCPLYILYIILHVFTFIFLYTILQIFISPHICLVCMLFSIFTSLLQIHYLIFVYHSKYIPPSSRMSFSAFSSLPIFISLTVFVFVYSLLRILFLSHFYETLDEMFNIRCEIFTVAIMRSTVIWLLTPSSLAELHLRSACFFLVLLLNPENGGNTFLRNVG